MRSPLLLAFLLLGCRAPEPVPPPIDYPGSSWGTPCPNARIVEVPRTSDITGNPSLVWECPDACPVHGGQLVGRGLIGRSGICGDAIGGAHR